MLHTSKTCLLAIVLATIGAGAARAEIDTKNCGTPIQSFVVTGNDVFETTSRTFVRLRGAAVTVTVPAGQTRCIKVRFTGSVTCKGSTNAACFIRAVAGDKEMRPRASGNQFLSGQLLQPLALGYEWVDRLPGGDNVVQIRVRTHNILELIKLDIDNWTMDVEVLN